VKLVDFNYQAPPFAGYSSWLYSRVLSCEKIFPKPETRLTDQTTAIQISTLFSTTIVSFLSRKLLYFEKHSAHLLGLLRDSNHAVYACRV